MEWLNSHAPLITDSFLTALESQAALSRQWPLQATSAKAIESTFKTQRIGSEGRIKNIGVPEQNKGCHSASPKVRSDAGQIGWAQCKEGVRAGPHPAIAWDSVLVCQRLQSKVSSVSCRRIWHLPGKTLERTARCVWQRTEERPLLEDVAGVAVGAGLLRQATCLANA